MQQNLQPESPRSKKRTEDTCNKEGPAKLPKNNICINLSDAKYDVIHHVCKNMLNWQIIKNDEENMRCDIIWNDTACNQDILGKLKPYQKLNHFPGIFSIARKNYLCFHLNKMRKAFPEFYNFFPKSFSLPAEKSILAKEFDDKKKSRTFIVKPEALSMGRGIFLTKRMEDIPNNESYVVQKYIKKPFLIDGLKFDLRIYVLLTSVFPLKIYIYKEGLARFATDPYSIPDHKNLKNMCQHLTNYSVNKHSKSFKFDENPLMAESGHKRSLAAIWRYCDSQGIDSKAIFNDIKKSMIKTICSIQPILRHCYTSCQPNDFTSGMCFEVLGFDVIIKSNLKTNVLEVNHAPSFNSDTPFDFKVKSSMLKNMFDILHCTLEQRNLIMEKEKQIVENRLKCGSWRRMTFEEKETSRKEYSDDLENKIKSSIGEFELIYPSQFSDEPYEDFIRHAEQLLLETTGVKTNKLKKKPSQSQHRTNFQKNMENQENLNQKANTPESIKVMQKERFEKIQVAVNRLYNRKVTDIESAQKERNLKLKSFDELNAKRFDLIKTNVVTVEFLPNLR